MSMIEKMARVLAVKLSGSEDDWQEWTDEVKSMLECLKEPTDGMKQVVAANWGRRTWSDYQDVINAALEGK